MLKSLPYLVCVKTEAHSNIYKIDVGIKHDKISFIYFNILWIFHSSSNSW